MAARRETPPAAAVCAGTRLHVVWLQRRRRRRGKLETVLELALHCVRLGSPLKRLYTVVICTYLLAVQTSHNNSNYEN
jgi:hypothetical protein